MNERRDLLKLLQDDPNPSTLITREKTIEALAYSEHRRV